MPENKEAAVTIDLMDLLGVLLHRIWYIILATVIGCCIAFSYTRFFVTPLYRSTAKLYVNNSNLANISISSITTSELTAAQKLVDTYIVILQSRPFIERVIQSTGLGEKYSYTQLSKMISADGMNDTQIFQVNVTGADPAETTLIANAVVDLLPDHLGGIIKGSDVREVERADYLESARRRISPSYTTNTAVGGLLGALLCAAVFIVMYLLDENIRSEDYLTQTYPDIPLLSVIPDMHTSRQ